MNKSKKQQQFLTCGSPCIIIYLHKAKIVVLVASGWGVSPGLGVIQGGGGGGGIDPLLLYKGAKFKVISPTFYIPRTRRRECGVEEL